MSSNSEKLRGFIITIYDEGDYNYDLPIGEVTVRALDWACASTIGDLLFDNTGRITSCKEENDE